MKRSLNKIAGFGGGYRSKNQSGVLCTGFLLDADTRYAPVYGIGV